ncbi:MAG TPA: DUF6159 family protein [Acidimicrobiales bacterium]|jgi:hypothetical protein
MNRLANAWQLAKASWAVLSKDRELVAIPIVAGIGALLVFAIIALPGIILVGDSDNNATNFALWIFLALAAVGASWFAALGQAAVVAGAAERMDGGNPTLGSAYTAARARAFRLLEWAILATVVAIVLDQLEERLGMLGRIVSWLGNVAFSVLSFLALPIIVFEDVGAIEGFKRSSSLLKQTWGEQVAFSFGMGLLGFLLALPAILIGGALIATGVLPIQIVGVAAAVAWIVLVAAVTSALSAVFKAALYRYAKGLPVDPAFDQGDLRGAFRPK